MTHSVSRRQCGSKEIWLDAAYDLLISGGFKAVKVMILAKRLNQTRTSFYWYFKDIAELHGAMIKRWEAKNTGQLVGRCEMDAATICEALFNVMDCWLDPELFDSTLDLATRNWARTLAGSVFCLAAAGLRRGGLAPGARLGLRTLWVRSGDATLLLRGANGPFYSRQFILHLFVKVHPNP